MVFFLIENISYDKNFVYEFISYMNAIKNALLLIEHV